MDSYRAAQEAKTPDKEDGTPHAGHCRSMHACLFFTPLHLAEPVHMNSLPICHFRQLESKSQELQALEQEQVDANSRVKTFPRFASGDFLEIKMVGSLCPAH